MTEPIPVYTENTGKGLIPDPATANSTLQHQEAAEAQVLPKGDARASAKSVKVTLVIDPATLTAVDSIGKKQVKVIVTVGAMKFDVMVSGKSYRKALTSIPEFGFDGCNVIVQATMVAPGKLDSAGLVVQPKAPRPAAGQEQETQT